MGVTIHYAGQLKGATKSADLIGFAERYALDHDWVLQKIAGHSESDPTGFIIQPHADCEPLAFIFGPKHRFQGWVKTQFAGPKIHMDVVQFLRELKAIVRRLGVRDEGEYWETGSEVTLRRHMNEINESLLSMLPRILASALVW